MVANVPVDAPALFNDYIIRNAAYALSQVQGDGSQLNTQQRSMALQALSFALSRPEAWARARDLLLALAPPMERAGFWGLWQPFLEQGLTRSRDARDIETEMAIRFHLSLLLQRTTRYQQAITHLEAALHLARLQQQRHWQARLLNRLGNNLRRLRRWQEAEQAILDAQALLADDDWSEQSYAAMVLGAIHYDLRQWEQARRHFQQGLQYWQNSGDDRQMAKALVNMGLATACLHRIEEAETHYRQAVALLEPLHDPAALAVACMNLGLLLADNNRAAEGLTYLKRAEKIFRAMQDRARQAMIATNLGRAYYELNHWPDAIAAFETSRTLWQALGSQPKALNAAAGLAAAWAQAGDLTQARAIVRAGLAALPALQYEGDRAFLQDVFEQVQSMIERDAQGWASG